MYRMVEGLADFAQIARDPICDCFWAPTRPCRDADQDDHPCAGADARQAAAYVRQAFMRSIQAGSNAPFRSRAERTEGIT